MLPPASRWRSRFQHAFPALLCLLSPGCIWSPPVELETDEPNHPPEILLGSLHPPITLVEDGVLKLESDTAICRSVDFLVDTVRDSDLDDVLFVRWYEDFDIEKELPERDVYINPTNQVDRSGAQLRWTVELEARTSEWRALPHSVMVVVADRPYDFSKYGVEFPAGQEGLYSLFIWSFRLADGGACPSD